MGHIPLKSSPISQGFISLVKALYPYAITANVAVTLPSMAETPLMLMWSVLVSGVKETLNSEAENFEFSIQGLRDVDWISRAAEAL
jgi:hypothetical protein